MKNYFTAIIAMMDYINPLNQHSLDIIHVVSYSETAHLAIPEIINNSIMNTFQAFEEYHKLKAQVKI